MGVDSYIIVPATDKEKIDKVIKTIEDLHEALNNPEVLNMYKKLSGRYEETKLPFKSKGICKALKKCLVKHRFTDAAKLMECLACEYGNSQLIFKAGFQTLENHPNMIPERMLQFMCHILSLDCLYKSEVALEAAVYFIKHERFQQAQSCLQEIETSSCRHLMRTDPLIENLLLAYNGLLNYIEWSKLKLDSSCDNIDVEQNTKNFSEKATSTFLGLLSQSGPWDIFVLKLIEMLEYYNKFSEAENALLLYALSNPLHIHAHIYLYDFYRKNKYEKSKQIQCLQKIVEICPSDARVLDYVLIVKESETEKCIDMLFTYLNYASNKNDLKGWSIFVELLMDILQRNATAEFQCVEEMWQEYNSFWPPYQFSAALLKITDEPTAKLAVFKATALYILENEETDNLFVCEVQRELNLLPYPDLMSSLLQNLQLINELKHKLSRKRKPSVEDSYS